MDRDRRKVDSHFLPEVGFGKRNMHLKTVTPQLSESLTSMMAFTKSC